MFSISYFEEVELLGIGDVEILSFLCQWQVGRIKVKSEVVSRYGY